MEKGSFFVLFYRKETIFVDINIDEKNLVGINNKINI